MKKLIAVVALLVCAEATFAGYTYHNGYYYRGGYGYSRWYQPGYYSYGYYYQPYYYYQYEPYAPAYTPTAPAAPAAPAYSSDWKNEVLKYARTKDDTDAFMKALDAMGYRPKPAAAPGAAGYYAAPAQGATVIGTPVGYSMKTIQETYGGLDLNQGFSSAARLVQNAQALSGDGLKDLTGVLSQAGNNATRVAAALAEGAARSRIAESTRLAPSSRTATTTAGVAVVTAPAQASATAGTAKVVDKALSDDFMKRLAVPKCASCHSGATLKGGFDVTKYPQLTVEQTAIVIRYITSKDPKKRCPKAADGGPGVRLTLDEVDEFVHN